MLTDVKYNPISNLYSFHSFHCSVQRWNSRRSQIPNDSEGETIGELTQPVASRRLAGG